MNILCYQIQEILGEFIMNYQSDWLRVESIIGSRRISNFCWACIILFGALGFFSVGISSYFGKDLIPFFIFSTNSFCTTRNCNVFLWYCWFFS